MKVLLVLALLLLPSLCYAPVVDSLGLARGKLAHDYHGIYASEIGWDGVETFERDGVRCRLFTKGCEEYIGRILKP